MDRFYSSEHSSDVGTVRIREVALSYRGRSKKLTAKFERPEQVVNFAQKLVGDDPREHFIVIHLDGRHRPIGYQVVSIGTATSSLIHPREVFQAAIAVGAVSVVIGHNHPSGDPRPSEADIETTRSLAMLLRPLGIRIHDHLILTDDRTTSFRALGWL